MSLSRISCFINLIFYWHCIVLENWLWLDSPFIRNHRVSAGILNALVNLLTVYDNRGRNSVGILTSIV